MQRTVYDSGPARLTPAQANRLAVSLREQYPHPAYELATVPWSEATARGGRRRFVRLVVSRRKPR